MQKLGLTDASFLYLERHGAPMNIASLQKFKLPQNDPDMSAYFRRLKGYLSRRVHGVEFMTRRLKWTPFDLDQPVWASDPDFNISNHLFRTRLASPGSQRQLERLVASLHEQPLDRHRPLWEMHLIDGLEDGTFALYTKIHHSAADGISARTLQNVLYSNAADVNPKPAPRSTADQPDGITLVFDALLNLSAQPLETMTRFGAQLRSFGRVTDRLRNGTAGAVSQRAPQSAFNVPVSDYRTFTCASLPLAQMRRISRPAGASVNDVLLAVCAGGLRRYLGRNDQLPQESLLAGIPVSLRAAGDSSCNNRVALLRASLATDIEDPLLRLGAIAESTRDGKALLDDARELVPENLHIPGLHTFFEALSSLGGTPSSQTLGNAYCNLVVSNVPGSRKAKYLLGAEMISNHPVSIAADNYALNITVQRYLDRLDLGITACLEALPDVEALCEDLLASWSELRAAGATDSSDQVPDAA